MTARNQTGTRWLPIPIADFEKWQTGLLEESADRVGAVLAPVGRVHRKHSVGSPVTFHGERTWLRVSPFLAHEMKRNAWQGTAEATAITGVSKPSLLHRVLWHTGGSAPVEVSAEVLTLVTDPAVSPDRFPSAIPDLDDAWFRDLAASLAALRTYPTGRQFPVHSADEYTYLVSATYRRPVPSGTVPEFGTEHMDLTWDNISAPRFCILDMEHWGTAVAGYAAAWLYLSALTVPAVANRIRDALADVLDTPSGRYAQLVAAALILRSLTRLPDPAGLAARLHRHTDTLLG
jgi:hypothetical protein